MNRKKRKITNKKKRKWHFSDAIVFLSVFAVVAYTVTAFILQFMGFMEVSATLTTCWYTFWTAEIVSLAAIKNSKTKHQKNGSTQTDDEKVEG